MLYASVALPVMLPNVSLKGFLAKIASAYLSVPAACPAAVLG
jgi:hypothetical protein